MWTVVHYLDVIPVRVPHERCVVAGMVLAFGGTAVVAPTGGHGRGVKTTDGLAITGLEGEVHPRNGTVGFVDVQFVRGKEARTLAESMRKIQGTKHCRVKALACLEVRHAKVNVVDKSADVKFQRELPVAGRAGKPGARCFSLAKRWFCARLSSARASADGTPEQ